MKGGTMFSGIGAPECGEKICAACRAQKPLAQFHRQPSGAMGRHTYCAECFNARYRGKQRKAVSPKRRSDQNRKSRYGLTPDQIKAMIHAQRGGCAICDRALVTFHVDHEHDTGRVRGLLCHRCNIRLGGWDDAEFRSRALQYLDRGAR